VSNERHGGCRAAALVRHPVRRPDGSDSRRFNGSGLGLYIVRRFVEQLGGTIVLTSAFDEGSVFRITLPLSPVPQYEPRAA
jgi:signal transduction histidine kinase